MIIKRIASSLLFFVFFQAFILNAQNNDELLKEVSGQVIYLNTSLPSVNVVVNNNERGTETDQKGEYLIKTKAGDVITFSYLGFETISIIVEDITSVLNIEMQIKTDNLEETIVKSSKEESDFKKSKNKFSSSKGGIDPETAGYSVAYVDGEKIDLIYPTLTQALVGKVPGVRLERSTGKLTIRTRTSINFDAPVIWDIDGVIYNDEPPLNLSNIKSIHVLKSLAGTNRYGSAGAGGVIVVKTKNGYFIDNNIQKKNIASQYTNKNFYNNDATFYNDETVNSIPQVQLLKRLNKKQDAFRYYKSTYKNQLNNYSDYIVIARMFNDFYKDSVISSQILIDLADENAKNPEILKAIGFSFQEMKANLKAISIFEKIFKLRPKYAQSYRDLANAYSDNNNYKRAWRMYMSYMLQGENVSDLAIGDLIYSEMEWMYYNRKNQAGIKESFVPKSASLTDFKKEVRLVVEWNTSEAEFVLEFVNPDKQVYNFEHTLAANQQVIIDEKEKGFSSKEFFIDDLGNGEWLVNINYLGNKKPEPTYFKITVFSNWGSPNQIQEVSVFKFENERNKIQLYKFENN